MSAATLRIMLAAFLLLSAGVATNLLMMQPRKNAGPTLRLTAEQPAPRTPVEPPRRTVAAEPVAAPKVEPPAGSLPASVAVPRTQGAEPGATPIREVSFRDITAAVQHRLAQRGYEAGQADGVNGLVTRAAILAFEHDNGLALTAEPSEALLRALEAGPAAISAPAYAAAARDKRARAEQVIKTVQQSLIALGYGIAKPNGRTGEDTERAIREFEMDQKLPVTGRISGTLVSRLARIAGHGKLTAGR
jgi:peptidoglycan hydrolase-like protein with peptidoglycan-binding domain